MREMRSLWKYLCVVSTTIFLNGVEGERKWHEQRLWLKHGNMKFGSFGRIFEKKDFGIN